MYHTLKIDSQTLQQCSVTSQRVNAAIYDNIKLYIQGGPIKTVHLIVYTL